MQRHRILLPLSFAFILSAAAQQPDDFEDLRFDRVAIGLRYAEAPVWSPEGKLLFADVPNNTIWQWKGGERSVVIQKDSNGAGGLAYDAQGRLYICESHSRRVIRIDKKARREVIADMWEGKRLNAPNDLAIRKDGHLWFTDPAFGSSADARELDFYGVFHLNPKGDLEIAAKWKTRPNGIAVAPGGHILYVTNSDERKLYAFDIDKSGAAANQRVVVENIEGVPGGVKLDEKGNIYVAARHLLIYSPAGKLLKRVEMPAAASNCAFGETDLESLFVTAHSEVYRVRVPFKGALIYPSAPPAN